ncbi:MAG: hypothetical protein IKO85_10845 [Bacteroidaceae bacterium]|nr:hypothetical protein [Bacteroidaceae bacterium]
MKKFLLLLFTLLGVVQTQADNEMLYGIYQGSGTLAGIGTQKAETYDVAMHLTDPYLVGMEVRGVNVPINTGANNATDYKAWLTTELTLNDDKLNVPDIASVDFTPDGKWAEVTFETPYIIPEGGIYVGYSITISTVDVNSTSDPNKIPLMCIKSDNIADLYIHTNRSYRKWTALNETTLTGNAFALVVRLGGSKVKGFAASFVAPDDQNAYTLVGKTVSVPLTVLNHGVENITRIGYTIHVGDTVVEKSASIRIAGKYYGSTGTLKVTVPAVKTAGTYDINFTITTVNGEPNEDDNPTTPYSMAYISAYPKHKPLMEEYTGTWCGWCPRGMAAMEAMTEIYGDDFVGVAFHNGDPMQITSSYPNSVSGFPHAFIDRVIDADPYYGTAGGTLGIQNDWKTRSKVLAPATIELAADWANKEDKLLQITSKTHFIRDFSNSPYRLTYMVVADDLSCPPNSDKSTRKNWSQVNYYSGTSDYEGDKYLSPLARLGSPIVDMKYQDVVIYVAALGSQAIENSLPAVVKSAEPVEHEFMVDLSTNNLVQDISKLRVVAALINTQTGEVVQSEKAKVGATTDVRSIPVESQAVGVRFSDLSGRSVTSLGRGFYIKTTTNPDGTVNTSKIICR